MHSIKKTVISKMIDKAIHNEKSLEDVRLFPGDATLDMLLKHYYFSLHKKEENEIFFANALTW